MTSNQQNLKNLENFVKKMNEDIAKLTTKEHLQAVGEFIAEKIKVRTRLGYGVNDNLQEKLRLKRLSPNYIEFRKKFDQLHSQIKPKDSRLTLTGSMLDNLKVKSIQGNKIKIGPVGYDDFGVNNSNKAYYQEVQGRIFLRLSFQEIKDARRFWLGKYFDLLKRRKII